MERHHRPGLPRHHLLQVGVGLKICLSANLFLRPEYDLPSQGDVIARTVELVAEFVTRWPDTAVLVGAYSVGKERIFKALAKELDARLWTTSARSEVWKCLRDPGLLERKVVNREEARVQVVDNKMISWGGLARESGKVGELFRHVLGVKPTGWTHGKGQAKETSLARLRIVTKGQVGTAFHLFSTFFWVE